MTPTVQANPAPPPIRVPEGLAGDANRLLWWIVDATAARTGDDFFSSMVSHVAQGLGLDDVFITECVDHPVTRLRTLARCKNAQLVPNVEYALAGTPCETTVRGRRTSFYAEGLAHTFPQSAEYGNESYFGVPIFDSAQEHVIGHIAFFDNKRMEDKVFSNPLFHIFANRAAAELQRRRAEEAASMHLQQLAHVARVGSMGELATAIAHEVNQPLAAITAYARACEAMVAADRVATPDLREAIQGILGQAERAAAITDRLRHFMRDSDLTAERVSLHRIARESIALAQPDARRRNAVIRLTEGADACEVLADPVQLEQVVFNLLRNALEAGDPARGPLSVEIKTWRAGAEAILTVTDNGTGVPPGLRDQLFHPFFTTKPDGMGIGLSLARTIARNAGGALDLDPAFEGGARFVLTLPIEPGDDA